MREGIPVLQGGEDGQQYPASISQRPSSTTASQARPSSVASWNRARRRAAQAGVTGYVRPEEAGDLAPVSA